jgi:hypothetical protein
MVKNVTGRNRRKIIPVVVTDNESAKKLTENPIFHRRTKHIQIRFHYIREQLKKGKLEVKWVAGRTTEQTY